MNAARWTAVVIYCGSAAGGGGTERPKPFERELPVEQLGIGCGALEIAVGVLELARGQRGAPGPITSLGLHLQRAAAARIAVEHGNCAGRPVHSVQRDAAGKPGQRRVIVAHADRLIGDVVPAGSTSSIWLRDVEGGLPLRSCIASPASRISMSWKRSGSAGL